MEHNWYKIVICNQGRQHSDRGTEIGNSRGTVTFKHVSERTPPIHLTLPNEDYVFFVQRLSNKSVSLPEREALSFQVQELLCKHGTEPWKVILRDQFNEDFEFEVNMEEGLILMREMLEDMEANY